MRLHKAVNKYVGKSEQAELYCPVDNIKLKRLTFEELDFLGCESCDSGLLHLQATLDLKNPEDLEFTEQPVEKELNCPVCHQIMDECYINNRKMQLCRECAVVWLSRKAMPRLKKWTPVKDMIEDAKYQESRFHLEDPKNLSSQYVRGVLKPYLAGIIVLYTLLIGSCFYNTY